MKVVKRIFFSYNIPSGFEGMDVKVGLCNGYLHKLSYVSPIGRTSTDDNGNLSIEYHMDFPEDLEVEFDCRKNGSILPDRVFRPAEDVLKYYNAERYDIRPVARRFLREYGDVRDIGNFLRENYRFPSCRHAGKAAAQIAGELGHKVASASGYVETGDDARYVRLTKNRGTFRVRDDPGHIWTLIDAGDKYVVCDPNIPPNGEERFVTKINSNRDISWNYRYSGRQPSIDASAYTQVDF